MSTTTRTRSLRARGTRAARVRAWGEAHPRLYAARHVVVNLGGTILAVLGVSALVKALLGGLLPTIDLDPGRYLAPLFQWVQPLLDTVLGWIPDVELGWAKYVLGFLIAVSVAVREVRRRQRVVEDPPRGEQERR